MPSTAKLPYSFCKRYGVIATTSLNTGELSLATRGGTSLNAIAEAQRLLGMVDQVSVETEGEFNRLLSRHFESGRETSFTEAEKIGGELNLDEVARELSEPEDLLESDDDAPIIRLINALITEAIKENASDIHVDHSRPGFRSASVWTVYCVKCSNRRVRSPACCVPESRLWRNSISPRNACRKMVE